MQQTRAGRGGHEERGRFGADRDHAYQARRGQRACHRPVPALPRVLLPHVHGHRRSGRFSGVLFDVVVVVVVTAVVVAISGAAAAAPSAAAVNIVIVQSTSGDWGTYTSPANGAWQMLPGKMQ